MLVATSSDLSHPLVLQAQVEGQARSTHFITPLRSCAIYI